MTNTINSQVGPFAIVPRWVIRALAGKKWALTLYCVLADHADRDTSSWKMSRKAIAAEMGCGLSTMQEAQAACVEAGCLVVVPTSTPDGDQGWNSYEVIQIAPHPVRESEGGRPAGQQGSLLEATTLPRTPLKNPSEEPLATGTPAAEVLTVNQRAKRMLDKFWLWHADTYGNPPTGIAPMAFRGLMAHFLGAGFTERQIGEAVKVLWGAGRPLTKPSIAAQIEGRVGHGRRSVDAQLDALEYDSAGNLK